jgi:hypothetical protein
VSASSKELATSGHAAAAFPPGATSVVRFGQQGSDADAGASPDGAERPLDLEEILQSVRETAYRWDFASDRIDWAANAQAVLGVADMARLGKGTRACPSRGPRAGGRPL